MELCEDIGELPHFNPDIEPEECLPPIVGSFRGTINTADALIFSVPEYAHGLPGAFKNALDWLVGDMEFAGMPVAIWGPTRRGEFAAAQLREVLKTMSAIIIEDACFALALPGEAHRVDAAIAMALEALAQIQRVRL